MRMHPEKPCKMPTANTLLVMLAIGPMVWSIGTVSGHRAIKGLGIMLGFLGIAYTIPVLLDAATRH